MFLYLVSLTLVALVTDVTADLRFNYFRTKNDPDVQYCSDDDDCNIAVLCRCVVIDEGPKQCQCYSAMSHDRYHEMAKKLEANQTLLSGILRM